MFFELSVGSREVVCHASLMESHSGCDSEFHVGLYIRFPWA